MRPFPTLSHICVDWLSSKGYALQGFVARGKSANVWKVSRGKRFFALKAEHEKSRRRFMVEKESLHVGMANAVGVGPRLVEWDKNARVIVMEFVQGISLSDWLLKENHSKKEVRAVLDRLFAQARALDESGLDHGQLQGRGTNILVTGKGMPVILDFEKASYVRKPKNVSTLRSWLFLNPRSVIANKIIGLGIGFSFFA